MARAGTAAPVAVHQMWAAVAGAWGEHADYVDAAADAMTLRMLDLTRPRPGERVLELACGAGGLGLAAAERVGPDGEVLVSDVVPEMVRIAAERAAARGLANVSSRPLDLDAIDQPAAAHDIVLCREGLMFAHDHGGAVAEVARVLRPGGRVAVSVWGPRDANPWLAAVLDSASAELGIPLPPPGVRGPFSLDDGDELAELFRSAGFADVAVQEVAVPRRAGSVGEWWDRTTALAGPLALRLASLPPEAVERIRARAADAVAPYVGAGGAVEFPGLALVASGRLPDA